ncbi:hypothetical protein D9756_003630 [Leucocoprinus leucothites]|uniref:Uncharacterized protein n=1 Tax=Leucocoprinus leucothites TaxID=201217 RepID=A0A8H5G7K4_9AGAR|nr:hypothetical protein D9756_003630 [Leucoagaricus leucothites]
MVAINPSASGSGGPRMPSVLSEHAVQDAFHSYLKSSLTQAKLEKLLDVDLLSSAEGDLMITGPALCLYFAALRCTTDPPSVPLPRSTKSSTSRSEPIDLSYENCPPAFTSFLRVWSNLVPQIQSLPPEHQHDLARIICNLQPLSVPPNLDLGGIAAELRAVALEISQRRSFQDRYANALQAALDFDSRGGASGAEQKQRVHRGRGVKYEWWSPFYTTITLVYNGFPTSTKPIPGILLPFLLYDILPPHPFPSILAPGISPAIEFIRETLYAALGDTLEQFPSLRPLLHSDPPRAYFASVSLAILFVSTTAIDFADRAIVGVLGTPLTLDDCPQELKPLMMELIRIGEAAREMAVEDDESAVMALSEGNEVPEETRMERVKNILLEGVGYEHTRVHQNGGRRSAEGRAVSFANRIGELAVKMTALRAFRERQDGVFKVLAGIGS